MQLRTRTVAASAAVTAGVGLAVALTSPAAHAAPARFALAGSVAPVAASRSVGAAPATQERTVQVWLQPHLGAAARWATAVSTPGSASFHHFLSPAAYTARFGASRSAVTAVRAWLVKQGFTAVHADAQRNYVAATAPTGKVEQAFQVKIDKYRVTSDGRTQTVESNDRAVTVPKSLATDVLAVTGLNNRRAVPLHTATRAAAVHGDAMGKSAPCSHYWGEHTVAIKPAFRHFHRLATQNCGYSPEKLRAAYNLAHRNTGRGERVAMIEIGTPYKMVNTLTAYAKRFGLRPPAPDQYEQLTIGRGNACGNFFDIEEQLDSESVFAMAPRADQLLVGGDSCDEKLEGVQPLFNAQLKVLDGTGHSPLASIESNSWGLTGGETFPPEYLKVSHSIMVRAAAEGVSMLASSGDNPGVSVPAVDPFTTAVGGTTVGMGKRNHRLFETGWSNDRAFFYRHNWHDEGIGRDAAGGGTSLVYGQPKYQKGVVPAYMSHIGVGRHLPSRAVPAIAADADPNTGILQDVTVHTRKHGDRVVWFVDGGTSLASPLVAGILADAQQR